MTKEKKHELYYDRKEQGLCVDCGKPNDNGKVRCDECLEYHRYANAKFRCNATEELSITGGIERSRREVRNDRCRTNKADNGYSK